MTFPKLAHMLRFNAQKVQNRNKHEQNCIKSLLLVIFHCQYFMRHFASFIFLSDCVQIFLFQLWSSIFPSVDWFYVDLTLASLSQINRRNISANVHPSKIKSNNYARNKKTSTSISFRGCWTNNIVMGLKFNAVTVV